VHSRIVRETTPPYTVDEVIDFYSECRFDYGISVDHVILAYNRRWDEAPAAPSDELERQTITLNLAAEFKTKCSARRVTSNRLASRKAGVLGRTHTPWTNCSAWDMTTLRSAEWCLSRPGTFWSA
jgi:hypothetical protein